MAFNPFGQCFRQFLDTALKNRKICQGAVSELPTSENRIKRLLLVRFYCLFCLGQLSKLYAFFLGHIALSQPLFKILS